ncbi:mpv17-like protein isoform X1 [Microtus oregoni]|uniref:mpv17-like protein isoform X1 n=1 Tax=Microtus oregoni TaxID=111838 RepID=UPI001BB185EE|nr:mpv17-like protein isoform X1 [Microtus oregoni]
MASWWRVFPRAAQRYPWPTNVLLYAGLFSAGDALQQRLRGGPADWRQTRRVATLAVTFHGNFNYVWLRLLERALPGRAPRTVLAKVLCDQTVGGPIYLSAFYVGMSVLQGKDDIFLDLKQKFWNTYKCFQDLLVDGSEPRTSNVHLMIEEWSDVLALCAGRRRATGPQRSEESRTPVETRFCVSIALGHLQQACVTNQLLWVRS